jgi:hypothetical protein
LGNRDRVSYCRRDPARDGSLSVFSFQGERLGFAKLDDTARYAISWSRIEAGLVT